MACLFFFQLFRGRGALPSVGRGRRKMLIKSRVRALRVVRVLANLRVLKKVRLLFRGG